MRLATRTHRPGAAYKPEIRPLEFGESKKAFREIFHEKPYTLPGEDTVKRDGFDGYVLVPTVPHNDYYAWLIWVYQHCSPILLRNDFILTTPAMMKCDRHHVSIHHDPCVAWGRKGTAALIAFQLGFRYLKTSAVDAIPRMRSEDEAPLEPGVALIALTNFVMKGMVKTPMRVECPGTMYAPEGNGKFDNVLRWDVQPPTAHTQGIIVLDWDSNTRERDLHGCASGIVIVPEEEETPV